MPRFLIGLNSHSFANKFDLKLVDIRLNTLYDSVAERVIKDPACLWGLGRKRESGGITKECNPEKKHFVQCYCSV